LVLFDTLDRDLEVLSSFPQESLSWILERGLKLKTSEKSEQEEMMMVPSYNQVGREEFKD